MNILVVQESNWITRNPHQQHHLMERLAARGHSVRVIDYDIDWKKGNRRNLFNPRTEFENVHKILPDVSIHVIRPSSLYVPLLEYPALLITHHREIMHQIDNFKPDIVIGFGILNAWIAARLARRRSIPFVYYWIDALDALIPERLFQILGRALEKQTLHNSIKIITINKKLMEYAINLGANPASTSIIGAGIDLSKYNPRIDGSVIRTQYGIKKDDIVLFFMGWLYHFSGLKEVALELSRSLDHYKNLKLLIVGDGDAFNDLQQIRNELKLGDNLILTGKESFEKIPGFIAASDICILPADPKEKIMQDIVPIKMYEYMAIGKPVICTKLPGIMREFGDKNGVLFVDSPEMVPETAYTIASNGSIKILGDCSRNFVKNLDWNTITDTFQDTLFNLKEDYGNKNR
jgi:glycosyltransferase involved in cell wall biosynthesis